MTKTCVLRRRAASAHQQFGRLATGVDLENVTAEQLRAIEEALYRHSVLVFPGQEVSPEKQYALTKHFDPSCEGYGHGDRQKDSILHPDLKTIPRVPQVQLIGNGPVAEHEGLSNVTLRHPHYRTFHKTVVSDEEEANGVTRYVA